MGNTRFAGDILRSGTGSGNRFFADMPMGPWPAYTVLWDDFQGIAVNSTNDWTVVKDSSATVAIVADTAGGELALTSAATTEDDGASIQGNEIFLPASGRKIWFETKIKIAAAGQQEVFAGLSENFATNPEAVLAASNRIGFQVDDGSALILCKTEVADSETSTTTAVSIVTGAYITLGFRVLGTGQVGFYINRNLVATHTTVPTTELAPALYSLSGQATGTASLTADYIMAIQSR